jgi:hypothetical protein
MQLRSLQQDLALFGSNTQRKYADTVTTQYQRSLWQFCVNSMASVTDKAKGIRSNEPNGSAYVEHS